MYLLNLTKEQRDFYWAEYEKAEREFEEACEDWELNFTLDMLGEEFEN